MTFTEFFNFRLLNLGSYELTVGKLIAPVLVFLVAWIIVTIVSRWLKKMTERQQISDSSHTAFRKLIRYIVYGLALLTSVEAMGIIEFLEYPLFHIGEYEFTIIKLILPIVIIIGARIFSLIVLRILQRYFMRKEIDEGRRFAISQFVKYILYTIALLIALQAIGVEFTLLLGGAAALLVGIGLGLQQTFNDLISGIILLVEGTVEVGDMVDLGGEVAKVQSIGIRTSKVETRDMTVIIIPNSKLVVDNVINWSNNHKPNRFHIDVGVAYGTDVRKVEKILLQVAMEHNLVLKRPAPRVQFINFGDSSLDFRLFIFSNEFFGSEFIKSDIRFRIVGVFEEHNIEIPFPQRDIWFKSPMQTEPSSVSPNPESDS